MKSEYYSGPSDIKNLQSEAISFFRTAIYWLVKGNYETAKKDFLQAGEMFNYVIAHCKKDISSCKSLLICDSQQTEKTSNDNASNVSPQLDQSVISENSNSSMIKSQFLENLYDFDICMAIPSVAEINSFIEQNVLNEKNDFSIWYSLSSKGSAYCSLFSKKINHFAKGFEDVLKAIELEFEKTSPDLETINDICFYILNNKGSILTIYDSRSIIDSFKITCSKIEQLLTKSISEQEKLSQKFAKYNIAKSENKIKKLDNFEPEIKPFQHFTGKRIQDPIADEIYQSFNIIEKYLSLNSNVRCGFSLPDYIKAIFYFLAELYASSLGIVDKFITTDGSRIISKLQSSDPKMSSEEEIDEFFKLVKYYTLKTAILEKKPISDKNQQLKKKRN